MKRPGIRHKLRLITAFSTLSFTTAFCSADDFVELPGVIVEGRSTPIVGEAISASQGYIGKVDLELRPILRTGEILEAIPGLIVTQHSGSGKANQYFLRGFNLDHGTDFATWVDGMPLNMVSHGHGQGYTDLNFLIPELTETISYLKGSYYSAVGNFSSAGSASISTSDHLHNGLFKTTIGSNNFVRVLLADSRELNEGTALYAIESHTNDGPWAIDEDLKKLNAFFKYTQPLNGGDLSVTAMAYDASWNSADQIPERVVQQGLIDDLGVIDDTVGGASSRYSLSSNWTKDRRDEKTNLSLYSIYYDMNIWSNFTYFLDDPINGDQFQQSDRRMIYGASATRSYYHRELFGKSARHTIGVQSRFDDVDNVALYHTVERRPIGRVREDSLKEFTIGAYYDTEIDWTQSLRTNFGLRGDYLYHNVSSDLSANSGTRDDFLISPKLNGVLTVSENAEMYLSAGYGFHSNDARGATIKVDPVNNTSVDSVDPLVKSEGAEIGLRYSKGDRFNSSIALWSLKLDSELLYVGDAGNTEALSPSTRYGVELANFYAITETLSLDFDLAFTDSTLDDEPKSKDQIPGAIDRVASLGLSYNPRKGWYGTVRFRHFGERPLVEDNSVHSDAFRSWNTRIGYKNERWQISLDVLNLFDSDDHDITYYYASRLPGEPSEGVEDRHYHVIEPRSARLNVDYKF